jgi:dTMP kinase
MRGRLITIEGLDASGKSTLACALATELRARGVDVVLLREPGGVALSERVRALVQDPTLRVGARAEALLYAAARAQLVEQLLEPTLADGRWVLLDRFVDSSLAYQGAGRELGLQAILEINALALGGLRPDRTLLLELPAQVRLARLRERGGGADRLEREDEAFFARVAAGYRELADKEPERFVRLDATRLPQALLADALAALADILPADSQPQPPDRPDRQAP